MKYLALAVLVLLAVCVGTAAKRQPRWHLAEGRADRAIYGIPGSDDSVLTVACDAGRTITLWGPIPGEDGGFVKNRPIQVTFRAGSHTEHLSGSTAEAGNGYAFKVELSPGSPFVTYLASGKTIEISRTTVSYAVPGGGERLIRRIVASCRP